MPELPDVEAVVQRIRPHVVGRKILEVEVLSPRTVRHPAPALFARLLSNKKVQAIRRRGKYIVFEIDDGRILVIHLRMTGDLVVESRGTRVDPHTRLTFLLEGGKELRFVDARRLGHAHLLHPEEINLLKGFSTLGPEPLASEFTLAAFRRRLRGRKGMLKSLLLRQDFIAGLGNIYADEVLFQAGLSPMRRVEELRPQEEKALFEAIRRCLREAVRNLLRRGEPGGELIPVREEDAPCPRCGTPLEMRRVSGRSSYYCSRCQPLPAR
ncbi:MAG: DNA-formamidopyrimidine glycosylase [Armatimonadota bacterium]|nr:DNA-formamidopyrimidine glycosylase [Armatimonadota bacterium]MDR5702392.1 DNA-formamidopyrimidine glycosylase [Armatimonadota bacterium]